MSNRKTTRVRVERGNAETAAVATPEIPGGYPDLTASQLDLIRERSTETVVDPGATVANAGDVDFDFMLVEAGRFGSREARGVRAAGAGHRGLRPRLVPGRAGHADRAGRHVLGAYARRRRDPTDATSGLPAAHVRVAGAVRHHPQGVHGEARVPAHQRSGAKHPDHRRRTVGRDAGSSATGPRA